jgi:hypothetical protein
VNVNDFYATESKWLKAADLAGRKHKVVIDAVEIVEFKKDGATTRKVALKFRGKEKGLTLNKTNAQLIGRQHGDDMDRWAGETITIYPTTTDFGGEQVECIRVEQHIPEAADDDEVPF